MLLPKFIYYDPDTLREACQIMGDLKDRAHPLAGGTDLIVGMKKGISSPGCVVSLGRVGALKGINFSEGALRIGACTTIAELASSGEIGDLFSAVRMGARNLGSHLIRNLATLGGNLVSARPAADMPPPLMAYGTRVVLRSVSGERTLPLEAFLRGPGDTAKAPDEILSEIVLDRPPAFSGAGYLKLGVRKALEISIVNVACFMTLEREGGPITLARVVLGAVAPTPMRAFSAEEILTGERPGEALFFEAGEAAAHDSKPIDDFRASAEYRRDMVAVLTRRTLDMALTEARARA